jgi:DNA-binding HxlR family transcriptional regulator
MKSYRQYCGMAKALDVIGDRWNLLIVRELLARSPSRYTDLHDGLPGIATNLLADRLRELEAAGVVRRYEAGPPVATTVFELTARGQDLWPVVRELGRWGRPLLAEPADEDSFRIHWLAVPARLHLTDHLPGQPPVTLVLRSGGEALTFEAIGAAVRSRPGDADAPDLVLTGPPQLIVGVLVGNLSLAEACARGLETDGDRAVLNRLRPSALAPRAPVPAPGYGRAARAGNDGLGEDAGGAGPMTASGPITEAVGELPGQAIPAGELFGTVSQEWLGTHPDDDQGQMLRSPGLRTAGRFFAFATKDDLFLKLPTARVAELIVTGEGRPCSPRAGHPMREWVRVRPADAQACATYLAEARGFVAGQALR